MVAGWRDDAVDHGQPDHDDDVHRDGDRQRLTATSSATITVIPALSCTVSPAAKTIDSGQSVTLADTCSNAIGTVDLLVVAGWRDDLVDHGLPDRDDDVHRDGDRLDRWCCRHERVHVDDHGEPGPRVHGSATKTTIDSGQSTTMQRHLQRRHRTDHLRVDAGWRDDVVDHGLPDRDDDVLGHGDRRDWCDGDQVRDDHGEPGALVLGLADGEDDRLAVSR